VVATISVVEMFVSLPDGRSQKPVYHVARQRAADGKGASTRCFRTTGWLSIRRRSTRGFVGMTIPFRVLHCRRSSPGHLDDSWLRAVRRWTMVSWLFLSFGLTLGMICGLRGPRVGRLLGRDPVENAGLLPWFTATAFLHSVMVQERRSMLRGVERYTRHHDVLPHDLRHVHERAPASCSRCTPLGDDPDSREALRSAS